MRFPVSLPEKPSSFRQGTEAQVLRRSRKQHLSAPVSAAGAHVDHPIRGCDQLRAMLYHHNGISLIHQTAQQRQKPRHVPAVEAGGGLIQNVDIPGFLQFAGQLQPLGLAAGEGAGRLAQGHV